MELILLFYVAIFLVAGIPVAIYIGGRSLITSTVLKYAGAIVIAVGGMGADRAHMGRGLGIAVAVVGLVMFMNGLKRELVLELRQEVDSPKNRQ